MTQHTAAHAWRSRWTIPGAGMLCLLLAALLAACTPGAHGPSSFPRGKLSLLNMPRPYALPGQIALGPDGNLWFPAIGYGNFATNQPSGAIGRLNSAGQFHLFTLPEPNSYPTTITFSRDGTLWFTAFQGNGQLAPIGDTAPHFTSGFSEIGRMTPNGQFHLFTLPSSDVYLTSIAVGADGNLWFTENLDGTGTTSQRIGRMTPAGAFADFPVSAPFANGYLRQIIAGPDGNLWFSLEGSDASYNALGALGKITPQGAISFIQLGKFAVPADMTVGPDHNLWFTTGFEVGRVTMAGQVRLFDPDPQASAGNRLDLGGIAAGPDGALWFATANVVVGRVTTDGAFTFYDFPPNTDFDNGSSSLTLGQLKGIVTGADGALWLTDDGQIGHFV
jgi:streptogramin lyase